VFVVSKTPHISSGGFHFSLSSDADPAAGFGYVVPTWDDAALAAQRRPDASFATCLLLPLRPGARAVVEAGLRSLLPECVLFLSNLRGLEMCIEARGGGGGGGAAYERRDTRTLTGDAYDIGRAVRLTSSVSDATRRGAAAAQRRETSTTFWQVSVPCELSAAALATPGVSEKRAGVTRRVVSVALPLGAAAAPAAGRVFAYLPTELKCAGLPFLMNADFFLAASREALLEQHAWNDELLSRIGFVAACAVHSLARSGRDDALSAYDFIPSADAAGVAALDVVPAGMHAELRKRACVQDAAGAWQLPQDVRSAPLGWHDLRATVPAAERCAEPRLLPLAANRYAPKLRHIGVAAMQPQQYLAQLRARTWLHSAATAGDARLFVQLFSFLSCMLAPKEHKHFPTDMPRELPAAALAGVPLLPCGRALIAAGASVFFPGASVNATLKALPAATARLVRVHVLADAVAAGLSDETRLWVARLGVLPFSEGAYCAQAMHALRADCARNAPLLRDLAAVMAARWINFEPKTKADIVQHFPLEIDGPDGVASFVSHAADGDFGGSVVLPAPQRAWHVLFPPALCAKLPPGHIRVLSEAYFEKCDDRARAAVKRWLLDLGAAECPRLPVVTVSCKRDERQPRPSFRADELPPGSKVGFYFTMGLNGDLSACTSFEASDVYPFPCLQRMPSGAAAVSTAAHVVALLQAALCTHLASGNLIYFLHCKIIGSKPGAGGGVEQCTGVYQHPSRLLEELRERAWLPTVGGALAVPSDAFLLTANLRGALGEDVASLPLVDAAVGLTPELARALCVNCTFNADVALQQLRRAAKQPAVNMAALQRCYRVLGARCAADETYVPVAQAALRSEKLMYVGDAWASARDCAWARTSAALPGMHSLEQLYGSAPGLSAAVFASLGVPQHAPVSAFLEAWCATGGAALSDAAMRTIYQQVDAAAKLGQLAGSGPHVALKAKLLAGALRITAHGCGDDDSLSASGPVVINDDASLCALLHAHGCGVRTVWVPAGDYWTQYSALLCSFLELPRVSQYVTRKPAAVLLPRGAVAPPHAADADAPFLTGDVKLALCGLLYNSQRGSGAWEAARGGDALRSMLRTRDVLCASLAVRYTLRDGRAFTCQEHAAWVGRTLWRVAQLRPPSAAAAARERVLAAVAAALAPQDATLSDALRLLAGHLVMAAQHEPETAAALLAQHAPRWDEDAEGEAAFAWVTENLQPNHTALLAPPADDDDAEEPAASQQPAAAGQAAATAAAAPAGAPSSQAAADDGDDGAMDQADDHDDGGPKFGAPPAALLSAAVAQAQAQALPAGITTAFTAAVNAWSAHTFGLQAVSAGAGAGGSSAVAAGPANAAPPSPADDADAAAVLAPASAAETAAANAAVAAAVQAATAAATAQAAAEEDALLKSLLTSQRRCALSRVDVPTALAVARLGDDAGGAAGGSSSGASSPSPPLALLLRKDLAALFRAQLLTLTPMAGHGLKVHIAPALMRSAADGTQAYRELNGSIKPVEDAVLADVALCDALQRSHAAATACPPKREDGAAAGGSGIKREHAGANDHAPAAAPRAKRFKSKPEAVVAYIEIDD
jgi:hypothetical protein